MPPRGPEPRCKNVGFEYAMLPGFLLKLLTPSHPLKPGVHSRMTWVWLMMGDRNVS